jgi:uncharacterized protein (TIGR00369 family)
LKHAVGSTGPWQGDNTMLIDTIPPGEATATQPENPLLDYLGIRLANREVGRAAFELDVQARHLNRQGSLQGGVIATLLDAAGGYAGLQPEEGAAVGNAVTVMLAISYLAPANAGRLSAVGTVTRSGRSLYFASATLTDESGNLVATAQGSFKRATRRTGD